MRLLGAVLAGGQSRRFGSDKALALLDGRPLIEHAIAALAAEAEAVIVCGRDWGDWVPDRPGPGRGPLGGINAALHEAAARGFDAVLTCGCDIPWLPRDLAATLHAQGMPAYLSRLPVVGLWPASMAARLDAHMAAAGDGSVRGWTRVAGAVPAATGTVPPNINSPADLEALRPRPSTRPRRPFRSGSARAR